MPPGYEVLSVATLEHPEAVLYVASGMLMPNEARQQAQCNPIAQPDPDWR